MEGTITYRIFTLSGYKIIEGQTDDKTIRTRDLTPGTYILKIGDVRMSIIKL
jgi:hypothetical protein